MKTAPCPSATCCARIRQQTKWSTFKAPPLQIVAVEHCKGAERFGYGARTSPEWFVAIHLGGTPYCRISREDFERLREELADG